MFDPFAGFICQTIGKDESAHFSSAGPAEVKIRRGTYAANGVPTIRANNKTL